MSRSRIWARLGYGLGLVSAAISALLSGPVLVLCEEPDGCFEIEMVARASSMRPECGGHEHESPPATSAGNGSVGACPCEDTVIASLSDTVRPEKARDLAARHRDASPVVAETLPITVPADRVEIAQRPSSRACLGTRYSRRSVVLRN